MVTWKQTYITQPTPHDRPAFLAERSLGDGSMRLDPLIAVRRQAWDDLMTHARSEPVEVGGMLLGEVYEDADGRLALDVRHAIPALGARQEATYFKLTPEAWEHICSTRDAIDPEMLIVGWYHTHPNFGAFFSGTDRASQRAFYRERWNVGLVIDPFRDDFALFLGETSQRIGMDHLRTYDAAREPIGIPQTTIREPARPVEEDSPTRLRPWFVPGDAAAAAVFGILSAALLRQFWRWLR
jgi:proteasome lid subunit RPN8/RPN11